MNTSVIYAPKSARALGYLKSSSNDIEIYVEDAAGQNLWVNILKQFLPEHVKLSSVNILGSRENVLSACKADQQDNSRKRLYIIDADLDIVKNKPKPQLKHLYRLRAYCIENYLLNEDALVSVARIFNGNISDRDASKKIDFNKWLEQNSAPLKSLFLCYGVTHHLCEQYQTVGHSVHSLLDRTVTDDTICPEKAAKHIYGLYRKVRRKISAKNVRECYNKYDTNIRDKDAHIIASGKDYIIPLLYNRMKNLFQLNIKKEQFSRMLATNINADSADPYLKRRLKSICA